MSLEAPAFFLSAIGINFFIKAVNRRFHMTADHPAERAAANQAAVAAV